MANIGEEQKRFIVAEIIRQVEPLKDMLAKQHEWQLCFYSNGDKNIPKGFFQRCREDDDNRYKETISQIKVLNQHKETVDQFITELRLAREFREKREEEAKDRRRFWILKVAVPIILAFVSLVGIAIKQAAPVVHIIWENYIHSHPVVSEQLRNLSSAEAELADNKGTLQATQ